MYLKDVEAVNRLAEIFRDKVSGYPSMREFFKAEENENCKTVKVIWRKKHGNVYRSIYINPDDAETLALLERLTNTEEFLKGNDVLMTSLPEAVFFNADVKKTGIKYTNETYSEDLSEEELSELLDCYRKDQKSCGFMEKGNGIPIGRIWVTVKEDLIRNSYRYKDFDMFIYPSDENMIAYLQKKGYYRESFVDPEDVLSIAVYKAENNRNRKVEIAIGEIYFDSEYDPENETETRKVLYSDKESIREICSRLYPSGWLQSGFRISVQSEDSVWAVPTFRDDAVNGEAKRYYEFKEGDLPDAVIEDLR